MIVAIIMIAIAANNMIDLVVMYDYMFFKNLLVIYRMRRFDTNIQKSFQ
jgi:hypothetical protein